MKKRQTSGSPLSDHARGALLAAGGITVVSPDALLVRLISANTLVLVFWRGLLSAAVLFIWLWATRGRELSSAFRAVGKIGLFAATLHTASAILFVMAIKQTAVANVFVIIGAEPLCAAILSALLFRERISTGTWIASVVVGIGLVIVFRGSIERGGASGDLLAVGAMMCVAMRYVLFRAARNVDMLPSVVLGGVLTALVLLPLADPFTLSGRDMLLLLLMGGVIMPLGQMMLVAAPRYIPAPEVALIVLLEAILAPTLVWLVLGEVPARETLIGGILIIGTLALHFSLPATRRVG